MELPAQLTWLLLEGLLPLMGAGMLYLLAGYVAHAPQQASPLIYPSVPVPVLPVLAVIGFMVARHWAPRIDERAERKARERALGLDRER